MKETWSILNNMIKCRKFSFRPNITADNFNIYFSNVGFNLANNFICDNDFNLTINYLTF